MSASRCASRSDQNELELKTTMAKRLFLVLVVIWLGANSSVANSKRSSVEKSAAAAAPVSFAPLPSDQELASFWNSPEFVKRVLCSYGFASDIEPRLTPEEQTVYREKVVPALREGPKKALPLLQSLAKPTASAVFDYTLGTLYFQAGDLTNAVRHFRAALAKFPDFKRAHQNLAFALIRSGQYDASLKPLTRAISLGGGDGQLFGLLGFTYLNLSRFASAEAAYRQALLFEPDNLDYKLGLVRAATGSGNYDVALTVLDELLRQYPERENLWALQANIFMQKDQPARALVNLEILRKLGKATAQQLSILGDIYMMQEDKDLALGAYLEAIEKEEVPNIERALRAVEIMTSRGAWEEADQIARKIRTTRAGSQTDSDELRLLKVEAKIAFGRGRSEEAIRILERVLEKDPLDGEALLLAGDYYAKAGDKQRAEFRYAAASKLPAYEADALVKQAQLLIQSQRYAQAIELLRKAQKLKPRDNVQRYLEKVEQVAARGRR